jgi:lysozyme
MKTSYHGIEQIKTFEGFRSMPYEDGAKKLTVGYGHMIVPGDGCIKGSPITMGQATSLLTKDLNTAENCVNQVGTELTQNQFDALVSFVYNLGCTAFKNSTMFKLLQENNIEAAAQEFPRWDRVAGVPNQGILKRRLAEQVCFQHNIYRG